MNENFDTAVVASIAHELKTPLNSILSLTDKLSDVCTRTDQKEILQKLKVSTALMLTLSNDIIDFSRIQAGRLPYCHAPFFLKNLTEKLEAIFEEQFCQKRLTFVKEYDFNEMLCIELDEVRLAQVLMNLISNSLKFTREGFVKLSIQRTYETASRVKLRFAVEDTGIGIAKEDKEKLFQNYSQLENFTSRTHAGSGLGLAICKAIITEFGGDISVESVPGRGTRFFFEITVPKVSSVNVIPLPAETAPSTLSGSGLRVLVAEDSQILFDVICDLLTEEGFICDWASDEIEAIEKCRANPAYHLILMDIHMPRMDGFAAADFLKREGLTSAPIVALTGSSHDAEQINHQLHIFNAFVAKPFTKYSLFSVLKPFTTKTVSIIDYASGIRNFDGKKHLYDKHSQRFIEKYRSVDKKIRSLLEANDFEEAFILAHSLKGLAGTLGFSQISQIAGLLETAIKKRHFETQIVCMESLHDGMEKLAALHPTGNSV